MSTDLHQVIAARAEDFVRDLFGEDAKRDGAGWRVGKHGSLAVSVKDGALVFYSHEEGTGGDAVTLWQRIRGGSVADALKSCRAWAGIIAPFTPAPRAVTPAKAKAAPSDALPHTLTEDEVRKGVEMYQRLGTDPQLCERIARARGWQAETIRTLALEAHLGWHEGALGFLYDSGVKLRCRKESGERVIWWHFGKPWIWRGGYLRIQQFRRVIIAEGETDAIRFIDAGAERDGKTLVVALPSASTFAPEWAARFAGKDVTLCLDNDDAGRKATQKIAPMLRDVAHTVSLFPWKEISHANA